MAGRLRKLGARPASEQGVRSCVGLVVHGLTTIPDASLACHGTWFQESLP